MVGAVVGAALILSVLYLLVATRYYSGYARLYIKQVGPSMMNEEVKAAQESEAFLFTQREIISSTPVIAMTLGTPGIRELKTFEGQENLFSYLKEGLSVDVGKKDELISVRFDTPYREEAQKIVGAIVDSYQNFQSKSRHSNASERVTYLQQEKEKRHEELNRKLEELQKFRQGQKLLAVADEKSNLIKQRMEQLLAELTKANIEAVSAQSAWDDVSRTILADPTRKDSFDKYIATAAGQAPSIQDDAQLRAEMLGWQARLQEVGDRYGPNHPYRRTIQQKIDHTNILYASAVFRRLGMAKQKEIDIQKSFEQARDLAVTHNSDVVKDAQLAGDVARLTDAANKIDDRMREISLTQDGGAPTIQVLEPPSVGRRPTYPRTLPTLALALLGGIVLGCGGAVVRDWYDYRLRSAEEIKATLGINILGLVPRVDDENSPIARGQKIHIDPLSEAAEAYRSLRTAIYFGSKEDRTRTIVVTSPERGDGKTTCASNLAISMAQAGRRVLLVDADLRAPMQDLIFGINGRSGLATVLQGKDQVDNAIRHTGIENLDLLPAGVAARNPAELLNSQKFIDLLEELGDKYDHVVIDTTPLLAVTDARIVAASADATLLVLRAGKSNRKLSELSVDGLLGVGAKLLGAVVNDLRRSKYSYYGSYGRYGYGNTGRTSPSDRPALAGSITDANGNGRHEDDYPADDSDGSLTSRGRLTG